MVNIEAMASAEAGVQRLQHAELNRLAPMLNSDQEHAELERSHRLARSIMAIGRALVHRRPAPAAQPALNDLGA